MHAAIDICADHGIVALITPTSYLGGQYFTNLRRLLIERAPPIAFDLVLQRRDVFRSVLQETAVSYFRKGGAPKKVEVSLVTIDGSAVVSGKVATLALPLQAGVPWPLPRGSEGVFLSKRMAKMATRLSDWGYRIKTGPLVWNRHRDEIAAAVSGRGLPIIWAEAVRNDGTVSLDYAKRDDKARIVPNAGHEWLITKQPCVLIQRTTAKEQSRRLIVSRLDDRFYEQHKNGVVVENHVNMLVPACDKPTIPIEVLAALFNTKIMDRVYRCISGSVAVSAYELENMPLPEAGSMTSFAEAVACGDNAVIEAEARKLFGERV